MPRTKGSKNRPKTNITKDYASQIVEKQETIASLNTEIASIQKAIEGKTIGCFYQTRLLFRGADHF